MTGKPAIALLAIMLHSSVYTVKSGGGQWALQGGPAEGLSCQDLPGG
jgi:hypothetical protein